MNYFWLQGSPFLVSQSGDTRGLRYWSEGQPFVTSYTPSSGTSGESGAAIQIGYPISDISTGFWSIAPLYEKIDETAASDTDYIYSSTDPNNDTCEVLLSGITNPNAYTGHYLTYRYQKEANNATQINLTVGLYQGTTLIAQQAHTDIPYGWITSGFYLTTGEAATITDYTDLRVRLTANKV